MNGSNHREVLLKVNGLYKSYSEHAVQAKMVLKGVQFQLGLNETVGIVGASGAGKSTIGRIIAGLEKSDRGEIWYEGKDLTPLRGQAKREACRTISMIFQDPYESLSPKMRVRELVAEPLLIRKRFAKKSPELEKAVSDVLAEVSLTPEKYMDRYPHELSGGERQRVGLARSFVTNPKLIIADEPTSMLDASLRLELLHLMDRMRQRNRNATLFITHDLALTYRFCDRLIVLDNGIVVESGTPEQVIDHPRHPFTQSLIEALLKFNP